MKNVGRNLIENAVAERKEKPYTSLYDFCKRMHGSELNRRSVESLIKAGAFDCFGSNRHSMVEAVEGILKSIETDSRRNLEGQLDLFSVMSGEVQQSPQEDVYEIRPLAEYTPASCCSRKKRSAVCTCPVIRWTLTGKNPPASAPTPSKLSPARMPMCRTAKRCASCAQWSKTA